MCHKPGKVLANKGWSGIGELTNTEKGKNVSATVVYFPPMMIFPRVRMKPELLDGPPPGSIGPANNRGWITVELFACWFDHFVEAVQPSHRTERCC